jgi:hypothetical protein
MRTLGMVFMALLAMPAYADSVNVAKSAELLDFNIARPEGRAGEQLGLAALDIDGDGQVSKAEAAGNAEATLGFDRADRNRNGRITTAEWQRYEKWKERRAKAREAREARLARAKAESASAGASRSKPAKRAP